MAETGGKEGRKEGRKEGGDAMEGEEEGGPTRRIFPAASSPTSLFLFLRDGDVLPSLLYGWFSMAISGKGGKGVEEWTEEGSDTDSPLFLSRYSLSLGGSRPNGEGLEDGEGGGRGGGGM